MSRDTFKRESALEKAWRKARENPSDFTNWTQLITFADEEPDIEVIREAYEAFLKEFPLCYVYWKKYADHEEKNGNGNLAIAIYEKGVTEGIIHSVELWTYYCAAVEKYCSEDVVRSTLERAASVVGGDYASHPIWDKYIMFEHSRNNKQKLAEIYEAISTIPLERIKHYWENYKSLIEEISVEDVATPEEIQKAKDNGAVGPYAVKQQIILEKGKIWEKTFEETEKRAHFESQVILMSFFDIQPLSEQKLELWRSYLRFEEENGTPSTLIKLYERCIISTCNYTEFWINYTRYLEDHFLNLHIEEGNTAETFKALEARAVLKRATSVYLKRRPDIHLYFAAFEEQYGYFDGAREIYDRLLKIAPGHMDSILRYIAFERRRGNFDKCEKIFNTAISEAAIVSNLIFLYIQYGRFLGQAYPDDPSHARKVFDEAIDMYPGALDIWRAYVLFERESGGEDKENRIKEIFLKAIHDESITDGNRQKDHSNPYYGISHQDRCEMYLSFMDYLTDFSSDVKLLREIEYEYKMIKVSERTSIAKKRKREEDIEREAIKKRRLEEEETERSSGPRIPKVKVLGQNRSLNFYAFGYEGFSG